MTRDEHRNACIEVIRTAMGWEDSPGKRLAAQSVLDAIPSAGADVHPIEATEEMVAAAPHWTEMDADEIQEIWRAMSSAGRLTNPQEDRP